MRCKMNNNLLDFKFKALSDATRREILYVLKNDKKCAGEIAEQFSITAPSISYHLSILSKSRLISSHKSKGFILYELNPEELDDILDWLKQFRNRMEE